MPAMALSRTALAEALQIPTSELGAASPHGWADDSFVTALHSSGCVTTMNHAANDDTRSLRAAIPCHDLLSQSTSLSADAMRHGHFHTGTAGCLQVVAGGRGQAARFHLQVEETDRRCSRPAATSVRANSVLTRREGDCAGLGGVSRWVQTMTQV